MKYFVTGAFGYIGQRLCQRLAELDCDVVAFCRDRKKQPPFASERIVVVEGDVRDSVALKQMKGCDGVFHLASLARVWSRNPDEFYDVNVGGTLNVLMTARQLGIKKVVYTSTAGVYGPGSEGELLDENSDRSSNCKTVYEKSKQKAEVEIRNFSTATGLPVVIVNPTRAYGPGYLSASNAITKLIKRFCGGGIQYIPRIGKYTGNYVYIDDVINGHLLAMQNGQPGRNYLLAGTNVSFTELFQAIEEAAGVKVMQIPLPLFLIKGFAAMSVGFAQLFGAPPKITPEFVRKYANYNAFSSQRIIEELGYEPTSLSRGLQLTVDWLANCEAEPAKV